MGLIRLATAFAAGAFTMYMLDPQAGRRRRALVRDKAVAAGHDAERLARGASRHATDQLRGAAAEARAQMREAPHGDRQLRERIRSELGRLVEQPGQVEVKVSGGFVTLSGSAKSSEMEHLIATVIAIPGVEHVDNRLGTGTMAAGAQGSQPPTGGRMH